MKKPLKPNQLTGFFLKIVLKYIPPNTALTRPFPLNRAHLSLSSPKYYPTH